MSDNIPQPAGTAWLVSLVYSTESNYESRLAPHCLCPLRRTAERVRRSNSSWMTIEEVPIFRVNGVLYGPVELVSPSEEEIRQDAAEKAADDAAKRLRAAGVSDDDIKALRGNP